MGVGKAILCSDEPARIDHVEGPLLILLMGKGAALPHYTTITSHLSTHFLAKNVGFKIY